MRLATFGRRDAVVDAGGDRVMLDAMLRNWPWMAARGTLAALFGVAVLSTQPALPTVAVLFGAYAVLDGILALIAAGYGDLRILDAWPVSLEGGVSIVLGGLALVAPLRIPRDLVIALALWGVVTGVLELVQARGVPRMSGGFWLLVAGGASSLTLGALLCLVPYADSGLVAAVIGVYGVVFGACMAWAAFTLASESTRS